MKITGIDTFLVPLLIDPFFTTDVARINGRKKRDDDLSPEWSRNINGRGLSTEKNVFHRGRNVFMGCARTSASHAKTAERA